MSKYKIKYKILESIEMQQIIVKDCANKYEAIGKLMEYKKKYIQIMKVHIVTGIENFDNIFDRFH